jgi:hypothetical protein
MGNALIHKQQIASGQGWQFAAAPASFGPHPSARIRRPASPRRRIHDNDAERSLGVESLNSA